MINLKIVTNYLESIDYISNVKLNNDSITFTCSGMRDWDGTLTIRHQNWGKYYTTLFDSTTDYCEGKTVRNSKQIIDFLKYQNID